MRIGTIALIGGAAVGGWWLLNKGQKVAKINDNVKVSNSIESVAKGGIFSPSMITVANSIDNLSGFELTLKNLYSIINISGSGGGSSFASEIGHSNVIPQVVLKKDGNTVFKLIFKVSDFDFVSKIGRTQKITIDTYYDFLGMQRKLTNEISLQDFKAKALKAFGLSGIAPESQITALSLL